MGTDRQITWDEFKDAFRAHYIPAGLIRRKAREFAALKQGNRSVEEYCEEFNRLALYAPEQVDTPAKRKDRFLEGLSAELQDRLNLNMGGTFAEFVNNAIVAEDGYRRVMAERKRSASAMGPSNGPPQKFRMVYTTPSGQRYRSAPVPAPVVRPPQPAQQRPPRYRVRSRVKEDFAHPSGQTLKPDRFPATTAAARGISRGSAHTPRKALDWKKKRKKKNCPRDPPVSDPEKTQPAEAALPRPSRAAWSPAYGQRPLPRIDGPTRAFGHPFLPTAALSEPRIHSLSLSLSLRLRLCFRRRCCSAPPPPRRRFQELVDVHGLASASSSSTRSHLLPFPHRAAAESTSSSPSPTAAHRVARHPRSSLEAAADHRNPHLAGETTPPASLLPEKLGDLPSPCSSEALRLDPEPYRPSLAPLADDDPCPVSAAVAGLRPAIARGVR
ncbi:hypothetical protein PR202_ga12951 [Eleusine coracana subsp. coracana]|uniref:Retrotransposon gag domain-containing protein n=1 Tax=Eleusine coracana subsp. coracana TaxID=191504 RepID=A0AAV5CDG9_ELECO|nr:hypothetical protein PR202_ga12951 [Eleusine coracana subsp. coracana]